MQFSCLSLAICLFGACAAGLSALPVTAQAPVPVQPAAPATLSLSPAQGATAALDHAHAAKTLPALVPYLTNEYAFFWVIELGDALSTFIGDDVTAALSPEEKSSQAAAEKVFNRKSAALMNYYSGFDEAFKSSEMPPPESLTQTAHGRQILAGFLVLASDYGKAAPSKKASSLSDPIGSFSFFPASSTCTFYVLSPTRVKIVPHAKAKPVFQERLEARLEEGQWRVGPEHSIFHATPDGPRPKTPLITPQAAAFLKAVDDGDAAAVSRMLQAAPALVNTPTAYLEAHSPKISSFPLSVASLRGDVPMMTLLLKAGAKVNADDYFAETALDKAAQSGSKAAILLLLAHGAHVAHQDVFLKTALHLAADSPTGADAVAVLLAHGAVVNDPDADGDTPLDLALARSSQEPDHAAIIELLRQHGAKQ